MEKAEASDEGLRGLSPRAGRGHRAAGAQAEGTAYTGRGGGPGLARHGAVPLLGVPEAAWTPRTQVL